MAPPTSNALGKRPVVVDDDVDMDDLDDVLDDFAPHPAKPAPSAPQTTATTKAATAFASRPPTTSTRPLDTGEEEAKFMEALTRGMEDMLHGLDTGESSSAGGARARGSANVEDETAHDKEFLATLEDLVAKSMADILPDVADGSEFDAAGEPKDAFRKVRDEAAERLRKSNAELQATPSAADDDLAALLESKDEDSLRELLEGMMSQLMGKEVLYEPLKELNDKFPSYLASNTNNLSASDLARYQAQHECASKIIAVFEEPGYKDDDLKWRAEVVELMGKMQEHGAPPAEIMGELPPELDLGPDGAPKLPDECVIG